ncbi:mevalonate kinase family protein [Salinivirga cyanobacteriivorans]
MIQRTKNNGRYYAKLMLFGEYSIINKSKALTVPFKHFSGELTFIPDNKYTAYDYARDSNRQLRDYAHYLEGAYRSGELDFSIDIKRLLLDIESGLYFDSSIPQGYGAGSSGALIAAIYDQYVTVYAQKADKLRNQLAFMENFFHGRSSGIDPLVAWYQEPLLIEDDDFKVVDKPDFISTGKEGLFLIDTAQTSKTQPLVDFFLEQTKLGNIDSKYLSEINNRIISAVLGNQMTDFKRLMRELSQWQLTHMRKMIPSHMEDFWKNGIDQDLYYTKLCGSGGGGFLLGYTHDYNAFLKSAVNVDYKFIPVQVPEMATFSQK